MDLLELFPFSNEWLMFQSYDLTLQKLISLFYCVYSAAVEWTLSVHSFIKYSVLSFEIIATPPKNKDYTGQAARLTTSKVGPVWLPAVWKIIASLPCRTTQKTIPHLLRNCESTSWMNRPIHVVNLADCQWDRNWITSIRHGTNRKGRHPKHYAYN